MFQGICILSTLKEKNTGRGSYATIGKEKAKKAKITTSNRVWITPAEAVVLETEDGALVAKATLKVLLESEYLSLKTKGLSPSKLFQSHPKGTDPKQETVPTTEEETLRLISESLMKELILPAITEDINTSPAYASLRQIYHSLILAEWFKRKQGLSRLGGTDPNNPYSKYINSGTTKGLESELPWEKQQIWQEYLKSYENGEYKLQDTLFGLKRMYWSGGVIINLSGSSSPLAIIPKDGLLKNPDLLKDIPKNPGETLVMADTGNKDNLGDVKTSVISFGNKEPEKEKEAPPTDKSLPALSESQSKESASLKPTDGSPTEDQSASSPLADQADTLGKCVTADTLLSLADGRQVPIVEVKAGDYALSLNEETQAIEPRRIKGLLDMGVKPVYKITTASGRSIKTTATHPYLTAKGWVKVSNLKAGDEIGVPRENLSSAIGIFAGVDSVNNNHRALKVKTDAIFSDSESVGGGGRLTRGLAKERGVPEDIYRLIFSMMRFCSCRESFLNSRSPKGVNSITASITLIRPARVSA